GSIAVGTRADFQEPRRAGELAAKIQRHVKKPVAHAGGEVRNGSSLGRAIGNGIVNREPQIVGTVRGICTVIQAALVGKGGALGAGGEWGVDGREKQAEER